MKKALVYGALGGAAMGILVLLGVASAECDRRGGTFLPREGVCLKPGVAIAVPLNGGDR